MSHILRTYIRRRTGPNSWRCRAKHTATDMFLNSLDYIRRCMTRMTWLTWHLSHILFRTHTLMIFLSLLMWMGILFTLMKWIRTSLLRERDANFMEAFTRRLKWRKNLGGTGAIIAIIWLHRTGSYLRIDTPPEFRVRNWYSSGITWIMLLRIHRRPNMKI